MSDRRERVERLMATDQRAGTRIVDRGRRVYLLESDGKRWQVKAIVPPTSPMIDTWARVCP